MNFQSDIFITNQVLVVSLEGKVMDATPWEGLLNKLEDQLASTNGNVIVDVENLEYMNSSGINFCVKVLTKSRVHNGEMILNGAQGSVLQVLKTSKMNEVFIMTDKIELAYNFFKN